MQADGQQLRLSDLAAQVGLSRSGLTRMVDRLERDGLLRRDRSAHDGRGIYALLNEAGREAVRKAWPTYQACVEHWLGRNLDGPDRDDLRQICRKLLKITDRTLESQEFWARQAPPARA